MLACDLCGASEVTRLPQPSGTRSLRSDRHVVEGRLTKIECARCGLVRDGAPKATTPRHYRDEYRVNDSDHIFYSPDGPRCRSAVFADWIEEALTGAGGPPPGRVLEIGAGRGYLTNELATRWADVSCEGLELGVDAARAAAALGVSVRQGDTSTLASGQYDVVIAIAVLEHVPSPTSFIAEMRRLLVPGGTAVLIQPTQDVPSYDVFFVDHLHHFSTTHLRAYAAKTGFRERYSRVGFQFMPNFSAHAWSAADVAPAWHWRDAPARTSCALTLQTVLSDMRRVDEIAGRLSTVGKPFGVFGLYEVFALTRAYSNLEHVGIAMGLDDAPDNPEYRQYPFPVVLPERVSPEVRDAFLTMNRIYYDQARARLTALGLESHPVLS